MDNKTLFSYREQLLDFSKAVENFINNSLEMLRDNFSSHQLMCLNYVYRNKRFSVDIAIGKFSQSKTVELKNTLCRNLTSELGLPLTNDFDELINKIAFISSDAYAFLEDIKINLLLLYMEYCDYLWHISPVINLYSLAASKKRENIYYTELCNAVFAVSDYCDILRYIGRAVCGNMCVLADGRFCLYNDNPFCSAENGLMTLKKNIGVYRLNPLFFEPVVDFIYTDEQGFNLKFGHEWIARREHIRCRCEVLNQISFRDITECNFYFSINGTDIQRVRDVCSNVTRENSIKSYLDEMIQNHALQRLSI